VRVTKTETKHDRATIFNTSQVLRQSPEAGPHHSLWWWPRASRGACPFTALKANFYESSRHKHLLSGVRMGRCGEEMESPFRRMAQRGALYTHLRGEATES